MSTNNLIESSQLYNAIMNGAFKVEKNRNELNIANGFPVPDQDTGSNLSYLFSAIRRRTAENENIKKLLEELNDIALRYARGNSGAIYSQYFNGIYQVSKDIETPISYTHLKTMFEEGYTNAVKAVKTPMEGTILTAMRGLSEEFSNSLKKVTEEDPLLYALKALQKIVDKTKEVLPQQKALKLPDAGALSFYYFIEGFARCIVYGETIQKDEMIEEVIDEAAHIVGDDVLSYRYCTEVLLEKNDQKTMQTDIHKIIEVFGDSQVVSETDNLVRAHVHSNTPDKVVDSLEKFGNIIEVKADDMFYQQALSKNHPGKIALIIDSIADVPDELMGEHVYRLPLYLLQDGVSFQDKRTISADRLNKNRFKLTSSQLNLVEVSEFLDPIVSKYEQIMILTVSSKMSGVYDRYYEYIENNPDKKIALVDSRLNSGGQGLLSLKAKEFLDSGLSLEETVQEIEKLRERTKIFVCVPDLSAMVYSGRLNKRIGKVLMALRFLPLITINKIGEGTITGLAFSQKSNEELLLKQLKSVNIDDYVMVYAGKPERAKKASASISKVIGKEPIYFSDISSVVSLFAGEGAYAVAYIEKENS